MSLQDKRVLVGVGGGIAAYKAVELVRELGRRGAQVRVAMTEAATRFVGAVTFTGITGRSAVTDLWDAGYAGEVHVELAEWADLIVVAPATANLLTRAAHGFADDVVLATLACARSPVLLAPAMHERMWLAPATQHAVNLLRERGTGFVGPVEGPLASGAVGMGRMAEPQAIADAAAQRLAGRQDLAGRTLLVSAGPTHEDLDPVRYLGNRSSGRMGYAVAQAARDRGARVILVTGPTALTPPAGVDVVRVRSAQQMRDAIVPQASQVDAIVMTAAVADFRPKQSAANKIKKGDASLTIELVANPDILAELGRTREGTRPLLVGFAMETDDVVGYARHKLVDKRVDLMIANAAAVFGRDDTDATLVSDRGDEALGPTSKRTLAERILDHIAAKLSA